MQYHNANLLENTWKWHIKNLFKLKNTYHNCFYRLTVEEADEDGMYYCAAMSDILDGEKVCKVIV